jgi:transposase
MLAHIDALDLAIANIEARIGIATAPDAELIELLCTIPGVGVRIAEILIAECGVDMSVFPTVAHLASWAAICPGSNQSGRKRGSGKTRNGDTWLCTALRWQRFTTSATAPPFNLACTIRPCSPRPCRPWA